MKKVKMILTFATVIAVVGSALAFKATSAPNLFICDLQKQECVLPQQKLSTQPSDEQVFIHPRVFTNAANQFCDESTSCPNEWLGDVYINL